MATVDDIVRGRDVYTVEGRQKVIEVVHFMVERNIGAVAVVQDGELAGIFSERDLMKRIVAEGRDARTTTVSDVMTPDPLVVSPDERLEDCMAVMKQHGFRHLPVCRGRELKGLISLRDVLLHGLVEKDGEVQMMRAYISQSS